MIRPKLSLLRHLRGDRSGTVALMTGGSLVGLLGMGAFAIDIGNIVNAKMQLQASTDAAALAGARDIGSSNNPVTSATNYSAVTGSLNANSNLNVKMVSGYPALKCFSSTGVVCAGSPAANGIVVKQQAVVPTYFAKVLGISSVTLGATATAGAKGGKSQPVDVAVVLDTTQSMNDADTNCSIKNAKKLDCALAGVRALLSGFWPSVDYVSLMVYPGLTNATQATYEYDCSSSTPSSSGIAKYKSSPVYEVVGLEHTYRTSDTTPLDPADKIVKAARGGATGCTQGITAVGGMGTYYADALAAAQTALTTNGRANVQKAIILLSDGDAQASSANMPTGKATDQCKQAITVAQTAKTAGFWVYSIAYGASTSSSSSCSTDQPSNGGTKAIAACDTMRQIASDSTKFFSDNQGGTTCTSTAHSISELVNIFQNIGTDLTSARLLPDNTT